LVSRPARVARTRPAPSRIRKCLVTAWRVTPEPVVRLVIEAGPERQSRLTMPRRVSSPRAAKIGALLRRAVDRLGLLDMASDVLDLLRPAALVHAEGLATTRGGDLVEARLHDGEPRALLHLLELELDQG